MAREMVDETSLKLSASNLLSFHPIPVEFAIQCVHLSKDTLMQPRQAQTTADPKADSIELVRSCAFEIQAFKGDCMIAYMR